MGCVCHRQSREMASSLFFCSCCDGLHLMSSGSWPEVHDSGDASPFPHTMIICADTTLTLIGRTLIGKSGSLPLIMLLFSRQILRHSRSEACRITSKIERRKRSPPHERETDPVSRQAPRPRSFRLVHPGRQGAQRFCIRFI